MKPKLISAIKIVLSELNYPEIPINIQLPKNIKYGDFSSNIAMQLAGKLNSNPMEIAKSISNKLEVDFPNLINNVTIAKPGFINIKIKKNEIINQIQIILEMESKFGSSNIGKGKKALIEFVSANPTGPLTVGHGRGAILGDVISNVLEWNNYKVEREYYYNNAGKQMKRLGLSVQARYLEILGKSNNFPLEGYQGEYIIEIAQNLLQEKGKTLQETKDIPCFTQAAENHIFIMIKDTLNKMNIKFDNFFNEQSLYDSDAIKSVLSKLEKKGLIYKKDDATWLKASSIGREQDRVIIKSSGEPTYRLPDIAYHKDKMDRGYDLIIDVLGADHMDAYPDVLAAIEQMNYPIDKIKVLIHQFVTLLKEGKPVKMSTRKAQYITLNELLDEVGIDVVRYFFLMRGMNSHLNFDLDLAKNESDENPVFYLQYAHARLCNIQKHAESLGYSLTTDLDSSQIKLDSEINLINNLMEFPMIVKKTHNSLEPQLIANYLQGIASQFHSYYSKERIVTNNKKITEARLALIKATQIVIQNGLSILGINAPKKM